jgi:hypothetical protein
MEKINEIVNEILEERGLDFIVSDIQFTEKTTSSANWQKFRAAARSKIIAEKETPDKTAVMSSETNSAAITADAEEECWKWKCFTTPTGTKCIKIPC